MSQTAQANTFGITSSTLLDNSYLDSLFSGDPQKVTEITEQTDSAPATPAPTDPEVVDKKMDDKKEPAPIVTTLDDPEFLDKLTDQEPTSEQPDKPIPSSTTSTPTLPEKDVTADTTTGYLAANITAFGNELYQIGILTADDQAPIDPITTTEQLVTRFTEEKKRGAVQILENILSNFGPEYRQAFDAIYLEGVRPRDYFGQVEQIASIQELDLSKIENQRHILRTHYHSLGWDAAKVSAKIEKLENYQDIEEEARDVHAILLAKEKQQLEQKQLERKEELVRKAAIEQQQQQQVGRIIADRMKTKELDGIPLDEKTARSLSSYMLEKKWQLGENQISDFEKEVLDLSRPENREYAVKVALIMHLLKTDPTLSRLQKKAVTRESEKIFSFLQREEATDKKQGRKKSNFFDD